MWSYNILRIILLVLSISCALNTGSFSKYAKHESSALIDLSSLPSYPFIQYELNTISHPPGASPLNNTYEKLERMLFEGSASVEILHIGGSHVQAGTLSNRIKENLIDMSGNSRGNLGFFFPYKLANTNGPAHIKTSFTGKWQGCRCAVNSANCEWGLSGYNVSTTDSIAEVKIWSTKPDSSLYQFSEVRIFHNAGVSGYCLELDPALQVISEETDSITGMTRFKLAQSSDSLKFRIFKLEEGTGEFTIHGIQLNNNDQGITYNAIGVNGASVPSYLKCKNFEVQLKQVVPDLVIFGIGINDANVPNGDFNPEAFERNYDQLIARFRSANPDVEFLFLTNNDSYYNRKRVNRNALMVRESMYKLAERHHAAVWDFFNIMGGLDSIRAWEQAGLAKKDKVHLTVSGYLLQADLLSYALREDFGNYLEQKYASANKN